MRLLLCLAARPGEVVSIDDLLDQVWPEVAVAPDSVYQAVASLRRVLGDDPKQPTYIATVPRLGYRMVATVSPWDNLPIALSDSSSSTDTERPTAPAHLREFATYRRTGLLRATEAILCLVMGVGVWAFLFHGKTATHKHQGLAVVVSPPQESVAVLPFLDLTEGMKDGEFADGMTEELIDKLSKLPGLLVPSPTSSFYFKDKQLPVADIARTLNVVYVLDGSVRKSGVRLRVAARLVRANNGYVIWSGTYDQPLDDILTVQDNIAGEVTRALRASIETGTSQHTSR
jgi:TolB-like protein/DNA-binding winged helix-turn-helix (wHTH) protein